MTKRLFVSNKDESARLFQSDFLERFTHVHWSVPIVIYVPAILYLMLRHPRPAAALAVTFFLAGIVVWTLTEYLLHRFVFHYHPSSNWGKRVHFLMHGIHHDYPSDSTRLVMPPSVSIPLAFLFYGLFSLLLPALHLPVFFAGFLFGYVCYDTIHYATHHASLKGRIGLWLKQHHLRHHFLDDNRGFGVSTPLWDLVFGTMYRRGERTVQDG